jgi:histidine triad (HIT) family protein
MSSNCLFCRIAAGELAADVVYEDEHLIAFRDVQPAAPVHVLVVPRKHIRSLNGLEQEDGELAGRLLLAVGQVAAREGVAEQGYRTVVNTGEAGGQTVPHLHLHLLGGTRFGEQDLNG